MTNKQIGYKEAKKKEENDAHMKLFKDMVKMVFLIMVGVVIGAGAMYYDMTQAPNTVIEQLEQIESNDESIVHDPCSLDTVDCEGEYPDLELSISPCHIHYYAEGCTYEERRKLEIKSMIREAAETYGVDVDEALLIAECESQFDERASNPESTAKGLYQFLDGTWENINAQGHQYDVEESIKQFMIWYPIYPSWWDECR